ncbi:MAG TPA: hypothetical protein VKA67_11305 [Verrucomicrobiae bacterium]|nr:hypothetical protein [Verrucomicrobiae bacterium]
MNSLLAGLIGVMLATNQPTALSNLITQTTGAKVEVPNPDDPVEKEFQQIMREDDAAQAEVDGWIKENQKFAAEGAGVPNAELNQRILKRFEPVRLAYEGFIKRHPDHVGARIAYASFLEDIGDEQGEVQQLEKARELDPTDPAIWNNLANYYGHRSPVKKAFAYYAKAIELDPHESVYYFNLATTVYLFRKDAKEYYHINEQQVFDKAMKLYRAALKLDPTNFPLASDLAQSYYGIKPWRFEDALQAWTNALHIAHDDVEREGVYIHFARVNYLAGRLTQARAALTHVTNSMYGDLKARIERNINDKEAEEKSNSVPSEASAAKAESAGKSQSP